MIDTLVGWGLFLMGLCGAAAMAISWEKERAKTIRCEDCGRTYHSSDQRNRVEWVLTHHCDHGARL